ncbi:MAG TPA: peptidylprolyl isomerase [Bacteroidales bacterium]|jgi:peptidyl-prolyl cis-trans isomerase SurA|nr:peptidylprolyl isomerase [Bacteroidales bacterium]HOF46341.1 peptidylprolyl isomerase [Bacteroidales bacterium]HOS57698.1 peptidylprolyl isomerase [Bacteroidales bacterium]HRR04256.1 peptidylprolyl isomerase [Bacteroidales bacterium]HXK74251.1 peptidylprolyl isomerase [Bacteroidales bacterium]
MKRLTLFIILTISTLIIFAQPISVDKIVTIVGKEIIMKSDIEKSYSDYASQYYVVDNEDEIKCNILEQKIIAKLMVHQALLDSVIITDQQVEDQLNARISYLLQQIGGDVRIIEEYYKKSIDQIKKDMRVLMREQMIIDEIERSLTENITITPTEIKNFFDKIPYDSLPTVEATYEFGHIVKIPPISEEEIAEIKERLLTFRERILRGEKFSMLARLYSDDPGSASKGGELGFFERGTLYPEFEAAAFKLKSGEISNVVQTKAGYHIIQMIERKGDRINVAHILLQPKPSPDQQVASINYLDSIRSLIITQKLDFSDAAFKYSDDMNKNSGGWVVNPYSGSMKFEKNAMDESTFATINKLIPGEYSSPIPYVTVDGNIAYRIIYLKSKTAAHKANLTEDYDAIKSAALENKKRKIIDKWLKNKVKTTNIKIDETYKFCPFIEKWNIP